MRLPATFSDLAYYDEAPDLSKKMVGLPPFWVVANDKNLAGDELENKILDWLNSYVEAVLEWKMPITRVQRANIKIYKGIHYISQETFDNLSYNKNRKYDLNHAKLVINKVQLLTEQHVADTISYSPAVKIIPLNNEERDKVAARSSQGCYDFYEYRSNLALKWQKLHRRKKICGETFLFFLWNEDKGDLHPSYVKLREVRRQMGLSPTDPITLMNPETGEVEKGEDGTDLFIDRAVRVGEVDSVLEFAERVLYPYPDSGEWEDVDCLARLVYMDVDEAKARWPYKADKIAACKKVSSNQNPEWYPRIQPTVSEKVAIYYFYHRPTTFLDRGYYAVFCEEALLEARDYPYKHGMLPCVRATDIDVPGEVWGMSFIQNLVHLQFALNNQASMFLQDQMTMTYPKIAVPRGARVRAVKLGNDRDVYEYSGPKPPEILSKNPTPPQSWQYYQLLSDEMKTVSAVFGQSVGQPPNGITANVALRMLDEQEQRLRAPSLKKDEQLYVDGAKILLSNFGTFYDPTDGRLGRILGSNDNYTLEQFDVANLSTPYEVIVQKTSGLPKSPAARVQTVLDFAETWPDMWKPDEVLEMVDIARPENLIQSATVARQCAEAEVDAILQGKFELVRPPAEFDEILPKYKVYIKAVQTQSFKLGTPADRQQMMLRQILTAEYLMWRKMQNNPLFAQLVMQDCPNFPAFFNVPKPQAAPFSLNMPSQMLAMMGDPNAPPLAGIPPQLGAAGAQIPLQPKEPIESSPPEGREPPPKQNLP